MLKIVFVEDEKASIDPVLRLIDEEEPDIQVRTFGFGEGQQAIRSIRPDMVVLDLWEGDPSENRNRGSEHLDYVWEQQFCRGHHPLGQSGRTAGTHKCIRSRGNEGSAQSTRGP